MTLFRKYDTAEFLRDEEDMRLFLDEVMKDSTVEELALAFDAVARARGVLELSRAAGVAIEEIHDTLNPYGEPDRAKILALLARLGFGLPERTGTDAA